MDSRYFSILIMVSYFLSCGAISPSGKGATQSGYQSVPGVTTFNSNTTSVINGVSNTAPGAGGSGSSNTTEIAHDLQNAQDAANPNDFVETMPPDPKDRATCGTFPEYTFNPNEIEKIEQKITIKLCSTDRDALVLNNFGYLYLIKLNSGNFIGSVFVDEASAINPELAGLTGANVSLNSQCPSDYYNQIKLTVNEESKTWKLPTFTPYRLIEDALIEKDVPFCFQCNWPQGITIGDIFQIAGEDANAPLANGFAGRSFMYVLDRTKVAYEDVIQHSVITYECTTTYFRHKVN